MNADLITAKEAVSDIRDGSSILLGGFGVIQGWPHELLLALRDHGARNLTLICNSPGFGPLSPQILAENGQISKLVASFGGYSYRTTVLSDQISAGMVDFEMVPQGTLVERIRAGGAGIPAFFTPAGIGTVAEKKKEKRVFGGREYLLEESIRADFAFVRGHRADTKNNIMYRGTGRNFNPIFATAAKVTIAEVDEIQSASELDPETVATPGIFIDRVIQRKDPVSRNTMVQLIRRHGRVVNPGADQLSPDAGLTRDLMAARAARLLDGHKYVNLGIGLPTLVSSFVGDKVTLHAENGVLGYGSLTTPEEGDLDVYNAGSQFVTLNYGASFFDSAQAFAMARGGHLDAVVLGGFQVSSQGDLANWKSPHMSAGSVGGAMDLASGGAEVIVLMHHTTKEGEPKLVPECTYPLTARRCVSWVVTNLALIQVTSEGLLLKEIAPGIPINQVLKATSAPLQVTKRVEEMNF